MCGIVGFWDWNEQRSGNDLRTVLTNMMAEIRHRGPDSDGHYIDEQKGIYFGHKRLSIVDLSPTGHQPMATQSGRMMIVYNGELYNTDELRSELSARGLRFKGHSDTEVLIEAIEHMGIEHVLPRLNGMFAFALYDRHSDTFYLARDHIGIKPLFWTQQNNILAFGSELKPFRVHPHLRTSLNVNAVADYLDHNYIAGEQSIFTEIHKLKPGHFMVVKRGNAPVIKSYWSSWPKDSKDYSNQDINASFHDLLAQAVKDQMVSDVPIGLFLSGGIDSSLIAALMQTHSSSPIRTFTIGFEEDAFNESHYARKIANHLGTYHTEEILSLRRAQDLIPEIPQFYDEPFADSSQLPMLLLSHMSRKHVTVCLSGDGGDELFLGYARYKTAQRLFQKLNYVPCPSISASVLNMAAHALPWGRIPGMPENTDLKLKKIATMLRAQDDLSRYREMVRLWPQGHVPLRAEYQMQNAAQTHISKNIYDVMREEDLQTYLPDDILQKSDRASMAFGLEARVPFLDKRVMEAAIALPSALHLQNGHSKSILKNALARYVPEHYFNRPKKGFSVPIAAWLRNDLRDLAEENLSIASLQELEIFDVAMIRKRWEQHVAGTHNWQQSLWGVIMFQLWRKHYKI